MTVTPYSFPSMSPGEVRRINAIGRAVYVLDAPEGAVAIQTGGETDTSFTPAAEQTEIDAGAQFRRVEVRNDASTSQTVQIVVHDGRYRRDRFTVQSDTANTLVTNASVSVAAGGTSQVIGSNANRRELYIRVSGAGPCWVGDANVATDRGIRLKDGDALFLNVQDAISVHNDGSSSVTVTLVETERS